MNKELTLKSGQVLTIKSLDIDNLQSILDLQTEVIASLADTAFLQPLTKEEFLFILNGNGMMVGAFHDNNLIAFRAMLEPEIDEEHLGRDAGLIESELSAVLYSEISNVSPKYQGNGLQTILGELLMDQVNANRYRYIFTTVAPFNIASLKDKFSLGMYIISLKMKYGNLLRYTMMKEVNVVESIETNLVKVDMSDIARQQSLLCEGWVGTSIEETDGKWKVAFRKK